MLPSASMNSFTLPKNPVNSRVRFLRRQPVELGQKVALLPGQFCGVSTITCTYMSPVWRVRKTGMPLPWRRKRRPD